MLGLIVSIMNNYSLQPTDVDNYFHGVASYQTDAIDTIDVECPHHVLSIETIDYQTIDSPLDRSDHDGLDSEETPLISNRDYPWANNPIKRSWASESGDSDSNDTPLLHGSADPQTDKKMYVAHRRAFRDAISNGIKICSHYNDCTDDHCLRFHVLRENLCPHAGRNNYCDHASCDKIVIKACRKGRRCTDTSCSFRH